MRFLKTAKFELDEQSVPVLAQEVGDFLTVGHFTLSEWETLSEAERAIALEVGRRQRLENFILMREVLQASTPEHLANLLAATGDTRSAAKILLREAVSSMAAGRRMETLSGE